MIRRPWLVVAGAVALAAAGLVLWQGFLRAPDDRSAPLPEAAFVDPLATGEPCPFCPAMVVIEGGTFPMRPARRALVEEPAPEVTVAPFALASLEVSRGLFGRYVAATNATIDGCWQELKSGSFTFDAGKSWRDPGFPQADDHPVACVSFDDATAFAAWLADLTGQPYRLPTEAEWAYVAARSPAEQGNVGLGRGRTTAGGVFGFDPQGLADLVGNVWEWSADCWHASHQGRPAEGVARGEEDAGDCTRRAVRGLGWTSLTPSAWRIDRYPAPTNDRAWDRGFRVARDLRR